MQHIERYEDAAVYVPTEAELLGAYLYRFYTSAYGIRNTRNASTVAPMLTEISVIC